MELQKRRNLLTTSANPDVRLDYVASMEGRITTSQDNAEASVLLRYIPDRLILQPASFILYLENIKNMPRNSLEEVAVTILNDVNNEVVARWAQVSVSVSTPGALRHAVLVEDRQPKWQNQDLLSRLRRH